MMEIKYRWSREVSIITMATLALIIGAIIYIWHSDESILLKGIFTAILAVVVVTTLAWSPRGIFVSEQRFTCKLCARRIVIEGSEIESITTLNPENISGGIRLFGSGGLFGFIGLFHNAQLGRFHSFITERNNLILITTREGKKYLFNSPHHRVERLKELLTHR